MYNFDARFNSRVRVIEKRERAPFGVKWKWRARKELRLNRSPLMWLFYEFDDVSGAVRGTMEKATPANSLAKH